MNGKIYNIIYSKLITWLVPAVLRKPKMLAWLGIIISPVQFIYQDLLRFRTATLYALSITPQVCYLQKLLNDRYDFIERRIKIADAFTGAPVYFFRRDENKPVYLLSRPENSPVYFFTRGESNVDLSNDFIVEVPRQLPYDYYEMWSLVQPYKLAGKIFNIQDV